MYATLETVYSPDVAGEWRVVQSTGGRDFYKLIHRRRREGGEREREITNGQPSKVSIKYQYQVLASKIEGWFEFVESQK